MVDLKIEYLPCINYSLINNRIAICQTADISNETDGEIRDIRVEWSGEFFRSSHSGLIGVIEKNTSLRLQDFDLMPIPSKVAAVTERVLTSFHVSVIADAHSEAKRELFARDYDIEIMPYDQWLGTGILPQSLASFVLPNHPAISNIIVKASVILKEISRSSSFTAYQSGNTNEVRRQVAAVYGALHAENIVYRPMPASYEAVGQRITLPDQVLSSHLGNCIELTLLLASVLEGIGINSGIILQKGHAYLAVWLVDDCCQYSVSDDYTFIEKKTAEGIDEMMVIECTQMASERTSFEDAQRMAERNLADSSLFELFIDFRRCRLERIRPLPQRIQNDGIWELPPDAPGHEACDLDVREHSRYDLSKITDSRRELDKMDIWERKLLDFSLRNSMLNLYLRQKAIQFISFDINLIEDFLQDGKEYVVMPKPNISMKMTEGERLMRSKRFPELHELITNDIRHHTLHTYQAELETRNTLKNIYRAARNAIEGTGANALYLSIGALRWFETELSDRPRYAPLLMLPVEMVYKKGNYYIRTTDEEIALNITLIEFLRQSFGIAIPGLDPLPTDGHGVDVPRIFAIVREALRNQRRWDIEEETILGVFSFSKYLMWNDIHNHRDALMQNSIVRSLVEQQLTFMPAPVETDLKQADKSLRPDMLSLPVPADSSQMAAVMAAGQGRSFILYGPPGTGKSQTITNLIANALYQGKRVLFVAEKMAALSVVQKRLEKIHLGPFCLEMHSNKLTKRHVLDQLKRALDVVHIVEPEKYARMAQQLYEQRGSLIAYMEALHDVRGQDGMSVYDCITRYESIRTQGLDFDVNDKELKRNFHVDRLDSYGHLLADRLNAVLSLTGQPSTHPLLGLTVTEDNLTDLGGLASRMKETLAIIMQADGRRTALADAGTIRGGLERNWKSEIFNEDAHALYDEWRAARAQWFLPRFFAQRKFIKRLRQFNELIINQDIEFFLLKFLEYAEKHAEIVRVQTAISQFFTISMAADSLPDSAQTAELTAKLNRWVTHLDAARDWYQWCAYKNELRQVGLGVIARKIEEGPVSVGTLRDAFFKTLFRHLAMEKIAQSSVLRTFEGSIFDETVARYRQLANDFQLISQKELYARLAANIPRVTENIDNSSEIGLLNRNISNGGRGLSLRDLIDQIPSLMPRLCPCMLMSPMSVAQFLDLSQEKFDLVVFDEASQMPTSEAVGAIARGKSVIVVGDPRQMPPTSFFNSTSVSEDEADMDDMESILEDCRTLQIPALQLNWHYRSKHESLIAFSNHEYYDGTLITFPSADDRTTKVKYNYVEGVYDKGGRRSNKKEAEAIVSEIGRRLCLPGHASQSIGVIAFSVVQQNLIEDLLTDLLDSDKALREAAEEMYEPIFVKNLENVQGDERDVILFSIGYGPDRNGKVSMNFGPLNNAGGERRLNVAVSRARSEMIVYSSLKASQIDLRRSKAKGVEGLRHFLEYAEQQILVRAAGSRQGTADSVIAGQIAAELEKRGHEATTNVGRSSFKVNVAVCADGTPGCYVLGILLDGEGYHNTQTTSDREIVQPNALGRLGWRVMRVWSVDWLTHPERVISRIEACLREQPAAPGNFHSTADSFDMTKEKTV
ncbi:MAG: DUF4011 domain-containing protein, partial [Prevotella sp.]|nr:DUF4011 domain-containing protein [Prevotella sp.]